MATNPARLPQRRTLGRGVKVDENATSRHSRHGSNGISRVSAKENVGGVGPVRRALGEVTMAAVNRKAYANVTDVRFPPQQEPVNKLGAGKEKEETGSKRPRSDSSTLAQRVPLGPSRNASVAPAVTTTVRVPSARPKLATAPVAAKRISRSSTLEQAVYEEPAVQEPPARMEVEDELARPTYDDDVDLIANEREVEEMVGVDDESVDEDEPETKEARVWPEVSTDRVKRYEREVQAIRDNFHEEIDMYDTTMVSEYAEDIFQYMEEMEESVMPNPDYMDGQNEITWAMRQTLVDWLLQVHLRYHMLPETLWIAVNIVDRFLTKRVVSLVKLQLVGVTAMFVAAKYEEILAPSVEEFVFMTESGYTKEEILKGERIMLQTLEFKVSHYCSPYSWMRKISKADDYDIQTRTLSKFLTEVTLLDWRFLRVKPSMIAAIGMYCSRRMLGGDWNEAFVYYSGFTEEQLIPGFNMLVQKLAEDNFSKQYVCKKYANKKFLKASCFAIEWALVHLSQNGGEAMVME
ncbi:cyclin [Coprinopsis marcescibilis]|uniref:Cyclin n=1 Tax=Coprinopsis marcescibilis TaxID=230819 RepID=A0A5C3L379_COPMA|nr:cyclin [Coprinopsis marcescibilis]